MPNHRRPSKDVRRDEDRALSLRCQGESYRAIASAIGFAAASTALKGVRRALARVPHYDDADTRKFEAERLEKLYNKSYKAAESSGWEPGRIRVALEVLAHLHKIRGLAFAPLNAIQLNFNTGSKKSIAEIFSDPGFRKYVEKENEKLVHPAFTTGPQPVDAKVADVPAGGDSDGNGTGGAVDVVETPEPNTTSDVDTSPPEAEVVELPFRPSTTRCVVCSGLGCSACRPSLTEDHDDR